MFVLKSDTFWLQSPICVLPTAPCVYLCLNLRERVVSDKSALSPFVCISFMSRDMWRLASFVNNCPQLISRKQMTCVYFTNTNCGQCPQLNIVLSVAKTFTFKTTVSGICLVEISHFKVKPLKATFILHSQNCYPLFYVSFNLLFARAAVTSEYERSWIGLTRYHDFT